MANYKQFHINISKDILKEMEKYRQEKVLPHETQRIFVEKAIRLRLNMLKKMK